MDYKTLLIHGTEDVDPLYHSVNAPIYFSSTYQSNNVPQKGPFGYSRGSNPTRKLLETLIADLEHGTHGFAFSSGMTATSAALSVLKAGEHAVVTRNVYGGTLNVLQTIFSRWGVTFTLVDTTDLNAVCAAIQPNTRLLFLETPSNPVLDVTDIAAAAAVAKAHGLLTVVDNTFLSPYLQKPLDLGADIVVESATKYLSGHSDIIAGVAATNDPHLAEQLGAFQKLIGGIIQPIDAYFLIRSIKTLGVRIERQQENAQKIVAYLQENPAIDRIYYPGLAGHPGHAIQEKQAAGPGAMLSFLLNEAYDVEAFLDHLKIVTSGASLGGVESLISCPRLGSHREFTPEQRREAGIADNMIRFSAGIEEPADIIADIQQALEQAKRP